MRGLSAQAFVKKFREKFPQAKEIGSYTVHSYVATHILLEAIQATGSTDGQKLADYIRKTPFNTALGLIRFDEKGDVKAPPYVFWQVQDGKFVQVQELKKQ
jgi:branched-chain amino acid transport system substrate-binding protein